MGEANPDSTCDHGGRTVALAILAFTILWLASAVTSDGFLDADSATHYMYAHWAIHSPDCLVNIWARPLTTTLFAPAAALGGRLGVRVVSLLCAIACAVIAWRLAILQRYRHPALAAIFTLGEPLFFLHSFSEMTELPFAMVVAMAFLAYRKQKWGMLAIAAAIMPLGRPEGFGFCLLAAFALLVHGRFRWIAVLPVPTALWTFTGWLVDGRAGEWWLWLPHHWPYASGSDYGRGPLLHFVMLLPMLISPLVMPAMWIGMGRSLRERVVGSDHVARCQFLIAFIPLSALVFHSVFYWLGKFSSNGELRYMLIAAPMWGLLSAAGWEWAFDRLKLSRPAAWAALALVLPAQANWKIPIIPLHLDAQWQSAARLVAWYKASPIRRDYPQLMFSHPAVDYFLDVRVDDPIRATPWNPATVAADPPGRLLIWDPDFSDKNSDPTRDVETQQILAAGWKAIPTPPEVGGRWWMFVSSQPVSGSAR